MSANHNPLTALYPVAIAALVILTPAWANAQRGPQDPIYLWGIQHGCTADRALSTATAERLSLLGTPVVTLDDATSTAGQCLGAECAEQLARSCGDRLGSSGILLGGHIEEQRDGNTQLARIRLWRVDLKPGRPMYLRYERLVAHCTADGCTPALPDLVATLAGQLLADSTPTTLSAASAHMAPPPYCTQRSDLPAFLCAPFNLKTSCGDVDEDAASVAARSSAAVCTLPAPTLAPAPACDCAHAQSCTAAARAACVTVSTTPTDKRPILRKSLGGSLLAAGGLLIGASLVMIANNYSSLTLRSNVSCADGAADSEKCYVASAAWGSSLGLGAALVAGGALVLWDPLKLFSPPRSSGRAAPLAHALAPLPAVPWARITP